MLKRRWHRLRRVTRQSSLAIVPLLADLNANARDKLLRVCEIRRYAQGDVILPLAMGNEGEVAFVLEGAVRVGASSGETGRIEFEDLPAGGYYGALSAFDPRCPIGSVIAREDCMLAILPAGEFIATLKRNGRTAVALLKDMAARLARAQKRDARLASGNHIQRVFAELLELAEPSRENADVWIVNPMPKHRELADRAETTEESAAAAVAHLIHAGLARRRYPAFEILDRARVRALCDPP